MKRKAVKATLAMMCVLGTTTLFAGCRASGISVENASDCVVDVTIATPPSFGFPMRTSGRVLKCI